jgi:hypothetical protein
MQAKLLNIHFATLSQDKLYNIFALTSLTMLLQDMFCNIVAGQALQHCCRANFAIVAIHVLWQHLF